MLKISLAVASLLLIFISEQAGANFVGSTSGVFSNPLGCTPAGSVCSGLGTNTLTWGAPNPESSSVNFTGVTNIDAVPNTETVWGVLKFFNGTTVLGTEINLFDLTINFAMTPNVESVKYGFEVITTDNSCPPGSQSYCPSDALVWKTISFTSLGQIVTYGAQFYLNSCVTCTDKRTAFVVDEGAGIGGEVQLIGAFHSATPLGFGKVLTPDISRLITVPEPNSLVLSLIGVIGMLCVYRRKLLPSSVIINYDKKVWKKRMAVG